QIGRCMMAADGPVASDWCDLSWTNWQPLNTDLVPADAPLSPGIYRIRRAGVTERLTYIGQTGRTLRERLLALANGTHSEQCPCNANTHTAAPQLWLLARLDGALLEFSCTQVRDRGALPGTEDMLLWRHRVGNKCSTEAKWPLLSWLVAPDEALGQARRQ